MAGLINETPQDFRIFDQIIRKILNHFNYVLYLSGGRVII